MKLTKHHFRLFLIADKGLSLFLFIVALTLFYLKADVPQKMSHRPVGEHVWAQIDRASLALNYYQENNSFWLPRGHLTNKNTQGIVAGEFPILPYLASRFYLMGGFHELYYRWLILSISIIGFFFAWKWIVPILGNTLSATATAILWIASPNLVYYSFSFLPDSAALAFLLISVYYFWQYGYTANSSKLIPAIIFGILAALNKVSALFPLTAVIAALTFFGKNAGLMIDYKKILLSFFLILSCSIAWILYSRWVNQLYGIHTFLMTPILPTNTTAFIKGLAGFYNHWQYYYSREMIWLIYAMIVVALLRIRHIPSVYIASMLFIFLSAILFFILMFGKAPHHQYYWVPFQIFFLFLTVCFFMAIRKIHIHNYIRIAAFVLFCVFINMNAIHIKKNIRQRFSLHRNTLLPYYNLEKHLSAMGIQFSDRVFSYQDYSFQNSLYLMNRKGMALADLPAYQPRHFKQGLEQAGFAILNDTTLLDNPEYSTYFYRRIGMHHNLVIYQLHAH